MTRCALNILCTVQLLYDTFQCTFCLAEALTEKLRVTFRKKNIYINKNILYTIDGPMADEYSLQFPYTEKLVTKSLQYVR